MKNIKFVYVLLGIFSFLFSFVLCTTVALAVDSNMLDDEHISPWTDNPGIVEYDGEVYDLQSNVHRILYACNLLENGINVPDPPALEFEGGQYSIDENGNAVLEVSMQDFYDAKAVYEEKYGEGAEAATVSQTATPEPTMVVTQSDDSLKVPNEFSNQDLLDKSQQLDDIIKSSFDNVSDKIEADTQMKAAQIDNQNRMTWVVPVFIIMVVLTAGVHLFRKFRNMKNR